MPITTTAVLLAGLAGCATPEEIQALEERVVALEKKVEAGATAGSGRPQIDPAKEEAARKMYGEIQTAMGKGDFDQAKAKLDTLAKEYAGTTVARRVGSLKAELDVIGKEAPTTIDAEQWFQGEGEVTNLAEGTTLIVFWEEWCPHCKREVPELQETYTKFKPKGLQMVGLTKVTKSSTDEKVAEFIKEQKVGYPIAKEKGDLSRHFAVRGIPAAAVVKDGKVIWRGHPAKLNDDLISGWL